jgi:hypothetical protein
MFFRKFANDTPYMLVYQRREDQVMKNEEDVSNKEEAKGEEGNNKIEQSQPSMSPSLLKFIEADNKAY